MEFGRKGQHRVLVNGVPFRMDGESYQDAEQKVLDMLEATPELFDLRAQDLGMSTNDVEIARLAAERGSTRVGDEAFMKTIHGKVREDMMPQGSERFWTGMGRGFVNRWRGARQVLAESMGDENASKAIADMDKEERDLYKQLDDQGIGLEDLGEIGADMSMFLASGATGVVPMAIAGAALAAADVKEADQTGLTGRIPDAAIGAVTGAVGPLANKAAGAVGGVARSLSPVLSTKLGPNLFLRARALLGNREAMANIVQDALTYTAEEGADKGKQIIGRAALDKVQQIVRSLPSDAAKGLKDPAALGVVRAAVKQATQPTADGVNVFNPAAFEKSMATLTGKLGGVFSKTEHTRMLGAISALARQMQNLPGQVSEKAAERAATALLTGPAETKAMLKALELATNPGVKQMMFDALVDYGARSTESILSTWPGRLTMGGVVGGVDEGVDAVEGALTTPANGQP